MWRRLPEVFDNRGGGVHRGVEGLNFLKCHGIGFFEPSLVDGGGLVISVLDFALP